MKTCALVLAGAVVAALAAIEPAMALDEGECVLVRACARGQRLFGAVVVSCALLSLRVNRMQNARSQY